MTVMTHLGEQIYDILDKAFYDAASNHGVNEFVATDIGNEAIPIVLEKLRALGLDV